MLDGTQNRPTKVHNTKDRILGEIRETFGLRIRDTMNLDTSVTDRRWGLCVEYVCPPDLQAEYLTSEVDVLAMNAERLATGGMRVHAYLSRFPEGRTVNEISSMASVKPNDIKTILAELERNGTVRREGTGPSAAYVMMSGGREPGED
jgi:hypothetical protein